MTRKEIITQLSEYFDIKELVCKHTYAAFGQRAWQFLDTEYLHCLLIIRRDILGVSMTCNSGGRNQRGLRCNLCQIVQDKTKAGKIYLSAHVNGAGGDFDARGMTAEEVRRAIEQKADILPYPIRMEAGVTWLHFDVYDYMNCKKINYFDP